MTHDFPARLLGGGARDRDASAGPQFSAQVATPVGEGARSIAGLTALVGASEHLEPKNDRGRAQPGHRWIGAVILTTAALVFASER